MANPIPCHRCKEVPDAAFLVSNRFDMPWQYEQGNVGLCPICFIETASEIAQVLSLMNAPPTDPEAPPVLEQIEADEGKGPVAAADSKSRKRKVPTPEPVEVQPEVSEEAAASDVNS